VAKEKKQERVGLKKFKCEPERNRRSKWELESAKKYDDGFAQRMFFSFRSME
jgi:hypothetical protein